MRSLRPPGDHHEGLLSFMTDAGVPSSYGGNRCFLPSKDETTRNDSNFLRQCFVSVASEVANIPLICFVASEELPWMMIAPIRSFVRIPQRIYTRRSPLLLATSLILMGTLQTFSLHPPQDEQSKRRRSNLVLVHIFPSLWTNEKNEIRKKLTGFGVVLFLLVFLLLLFLRHLDIFEMVRNEDERELSKRYNCDHIDSTKPQEMLACLEQKMVFSPALPHFLSFMQHLLLMPGKTLEFFLG